MKKSAVFFPYIILFFVISLTSCSTSKKLSNTNTKPNTASSRKETPAAIENNSGINIDGMLWYAKQQLSTPYKYGSSNPKNGGLDCSGLLYYVFTHFDIKVPRTSNDYMSFGKPVSKQEAVKGDVIIFTGSDAEQKTGGHVGIIIDNSNTISFIHSSTSKGVIISKLSEPYYDKRFLKIVRIIQ